jgi:GDP-L-fucose synthase
VVIHLAAVVGGRQKIEENPLDVALDLVIDSAVINWCSRNNVDRLLFFSSSAVYPISFQKDNLNSKKLDESMIDFENNIGIPDLTYGWAKMTGEYLCKIAHRSTGLKSICYRPFSGYGEDQNPAYPFPAIIRRIVKREDPVEIWSNSIRDFVYIDDILNFVRDTMYTIDDGSALNIGTSIPTSFSELVNISSEIAGYSPEVKILENKPLGVYYRVSKTSIDFDVDLREGIRRTINFLTNNS